MRFKNFYLTEMPKIVNGSQGDWSKTKDHWNNFENLLKNSTLIKEYKKDYIYRICKDRYYKSVNIFCMNPDENSNTHVTGIMQLRKEYPIKKYKYPQVSWVAVHPDFRNKSIGTGLYLTAISHYGGIVSDTSLTKSNTGGSQNIWRTLTNTQHVYAYNGNMFKELDKYDIDSDEYDSYDILFVVSETPIKGATRDD